jgi:hypothetical protein
MVTPGPRLRTGRTQTKPSSSSPNVGPDQGAPVGGPETVLEAAYGLPSWGSHRAQASHPAPAAARPVRAIAQPAGHASAARPRSLGARGAVHGGASPERARRAPRGPGAPTAHAGSRPNFGPGGVRVSQKRVERLMRRHGPSGLVQRRRRETTIRLSESARGFRLGCGVTSRPRPRTSPGRRHHAHPDLAVLHIPGGGAGLLRPPGGRLVDMRRPAG